MLAQGCAQTKSAGKDVLQLVIFAVIMMLIVYALLVFYVGWSGYRGLGIKGNRIFLIAYSAILLLLSVSFILGRFGGGSAVLTIIGNYWLALFSLSLMILPVIHLIMLILRFTRLDRNKIRVAATTLTLVLLLGTLLYGSYMAYTPKANSYSIKIDKSYKQDLNVVMFSDTHFGYLSGANHAKRLVKEVNALQPDLIIIPGDIIDDDLEIVEKKQIFSILSQLEAPLGVYGSLGNHDKFRGKMDELITAIETSNINILYDETIIIDDGIAIIGRKDYSEGERATTAQLAAELDQQMPIILLDHQPYEFAEAEQAGVDLLVAGHTHRGQIMPGNLITQRLFENDWGYLQKGSLHTIVSSGYGFWGPPIRIGTQSEIVQIHIDFNN